MFTFCIDRINYEVSSLRVVDHIAQSLYIEMTYDFHEIKREIYYSTTVNLGGDDLNYFISRGIMEIKKEFDEYLEIVNCISEKLSSE